jgi:hypothetical protein
MVRRSFSSHDERRVVICRHDPNHKEVFGRARELKLERDRYLFIYRFLWSIFVVNENSALANKIKERYLMNIISVEQFRRDYPEALLNKCRMDTTREVTWKVARKTSIEIAKRLLREGVSILRSRK